MSSVFDWAQKLVVVDHDGDAMGPAREESLAGLSLPMRPGRLAQLGVETLLCGGISQPMAAMIQSHGIRVVAGVAGKVDEVLSAFFENRLPAPEFAMPGWCFVPPPLGRGKRGRCRHGRGPGHGPSRGGGRGRGSRGT